jgi:catechol 2,3-dioxygenase-like lactoylglutathione lyase family enzyme
MADQPSDKSRLVGINHIALEVGDIDEALEFYGELFDFDLRGRTETMAFLDMGDQFLALSEGRDQEPDAHRHFGLVVDDRSPLRAKLEDLDAEILPGSGLDFRDPWGNYIQIVEYGAIQFTKHEDILRGMEMEDLDKTSDALDQLRDKGLWPDEDD